MEFALARAASGMLSGRVTRSRGKRSIIAAQEDAGAVPLADATLHVRPLAFNQPHAPKK